MLTLCSVAVDAWYRLWRRSPISVAPAGAQEFFLGTLPRIPLRFASLHPGLLSRRAYGACTFVDSGAFLFETDIRFYSRVLPSLIFAPPKVAGTDPFRATVAAATSETSCCVLAVTGVKGIFHAVTQFQRSSQRPFLSLSLNKRSPASLIYFVLGLNLN